jgi:hypothetical protein
MNDDLDSLPDAQLDELCAVAEGWQKTICSAQNFIERGGMRFPNYFWEGEATAWWHPTDENATGVYGKPPNYCGSFERVRAALEKHKTVSVTWTSGSWDVTIYDEVGEGETFDMPIIGEADDPCLGRAAVVCLLRARRAEKGAQP